MAQTTTSSATKKSKPADTKETKKDTGMRTAKSPAQDSVQGYDPAKKALIYYVRETNDTKKVVSSYKFDKSDPIGYNPLLVCCNEVLFPHEFFQQYNCKHTYEVFERCSQFGGAKDREKYRRYNNSSDCVHNRTRKTSLI